jgi:small-conductance mechanosensitive channel
MPAAHPAMAVDTGHWIGAGVALLIMLVVLSLLRLLFNRRAHRMAQAVLRGELTPQVETRLRVLERLVYALVVVVGVAAALSQFAAVRAIGHSLLTSGAIAAAILGFAARQTLANVVAGVMIAVTQPVRLGDQIAVGDAVGVVEDVRLSFTTLRAGGGQRILIPNEQLASGVLRNDSIGDAAVAPNVSVWIAPNADAARAVDALRQELGTDAVSVAEATPTGVRLAVGGEPVAPIDKPAREADLRARCLHRLHAEGLLPG